MAQEQQAIASQLVMMRRQQHAKLPLRPNEGGSAKSSMSSPVRVREAAEAPYTLTPLPSAASAPERTAAYNNYATNGGSTSQASHGLNGGMPSRGGQVSYTEYMVEGLVAPTADMNLRSWHYPSPPPAERLPSRPLAVSASAPSPSAHACDGLPSHVQLCGEQHCGAASCAQGQTRQGVASVGAAVGSTVGPGPTDSLARLSLSPGSKMRDLAQMLLGESTTGTEVVMGDAVQAATAARAAAAVAMAAAPAKTAAQMADVEMRATAETVATALPAPLQLDPGYRRSDGCHGGVGDHASHHGVRASHGGCGGCGGCGASSGAARATGMASMVAGEEALPTARAAGSVTDGEVVFLEQNDSSLQRAEARLGMWNREPPMATFRRRALARTQS